MLWSYCQKPEILRHVFSPFFTFSCKVNAPEITLPSGRTSASFPGCALSQLLATVT